MQLFLELDPNYKSFCKFSVISETNYQIKLSMEYGNDY